MKSETRTVTEVDKSEHFKTNAIQEIDKLNADIAAHKEQLQKLPEAAKRLLADSLNGELAKPEKATQERDKLAGRKVALMVEEIQLLKRKSDIGPLVEASNQAEIKRLTRQRDARIQELQEAVKALSIPDPQKQGMVNTDRDVVTLKRRINELRQPVTMLTATDTARLAELRNELAKALAI